MARAAIRLACFGLLLAVAVIWLVLGPRSFVLSAGAVGFGILGLVFVVAECAGWRELVVHYEWAGWLRFRTWGAHSVTEVPIEAICRVSVVQSARLGKQYLRVEMVNGRVLEFWYALLPHVDELARALQERAGL